MLKYEMEGGNLPVLIARPDPLHRKRRYELDALQYENGDQFRRKIQLGD